MTLYTAYTALAFSAFTSATILPGTSEAAFVLFIRQYPAHAYGAWLCAGLANGLGSIVSYLMGRIIPPKKMPSEKTLKLLEKYGTWSLLAAWLPIVGDALPIAAGWLRLNPWKCALMLLAGKVLRYAFILYGIRHFTAA